MPLIIPFPSQGVLPECEPLIGVPPTVPYAVRDIDMACGLFMDEIVNCRTVSEALALKDVIATCAMNLLALESSALDRADRLSKKEGA